MRLACVYPEHLGEPQARVLQTAATVAALARQGAQVHLLTGWFRGLPDRLAQLGLAGLAGLRVEALPMCRPGPGLRLPFGWGGAFHLAALGRLRRLARQGLAAVWVRHLKLADYLLAHGLTTPLLYEAHEFFARTAQEEGADAAKVAALGEQEQRVLRGAARVAAISRPLARDLEALPGVPQPVVVAPSGVDQAFFRLPQDRREPDLVAYAGGLSPWKGVDLLLKAAALLPQARVEVLGGRPGSADWRRLEGLAGELGLAPPRLLLRPRAGQDAVGELLARASVAVWPGSGQQAIARDYTSPLKLFEYLASGAAVAAPRLPAAQSVLSEGEDARLFTPDDPAALAEALAGLLADAGVARRLGERGRELALTYTWDARARVLLGALETLTP
ncbi:MAG: glycosyltransferase [Deltaproteobacteria bacterium]|nr:glycosyltransferase [Deltaproteobacteria bacterium]